MPKGVKGQDRRRGLARATRSASGPGRGDRGRAVFRSDDGGETWTRLSDNPELRQRAWYYMHIFADPGNAETVWVLNLSMLEVDRWREHLHRDRDPARRQPRPLDRPEESQRMIEGNDGGALRLARRRRHLVEHLQPADGRALPRHRPTTSSPTASTARSRTTRRSSIPSTPNKGAITERRHLAGRRRRERLHRVRPGRPEHHLRRQLASRHDPLRPPHAGSRATSRSGRRTRSAMGPRR